MYKVIKNFRDLKDGNHYKVGDTYPKKGKPDSERAALLASKNNKAGTPLIEEVKEPKKVEKEPKPEEPKEEKTKKEPKKKTTKAKTPRKKKGEN